MCKYVNMSYPGCISTLHSVSQGSTTILTRLQCLVKINKCINIKKVILTFMVSFSLTRPYFWRIDSTCKSFKWAMLVSECSSVLLHFLWKQGRSLTSQQTHAAWQSIRHPPARYCTVSCCLYDSWLMISHCAKAESIQIKSGSFDSHKHLLHHWQNLKMKQKPWKQWSYEWSYQKLNLNAF